MIKKQIGFQLASYTYPDEYTQMRSQVQALQAKGWEAQEPIHLGVRKDANARDVDVIVVPMIKYEWVDEEVPAVRSVGRPKKVE